MNTSCEYHEDTNKLTFLDAQHPNHDFPQFVLEKPLESINSSRTFCDRSNTHSPLNNELHDNTRAKNTFGEGPYPFQTEPVLEHGYHNVPFNFHYDEHHDDFSRYRQLESPMYNSQNNYDINYMQHLTQLTSHIDDGTSGLSNQQHCAIPIGKRRPRAVMISADEQEMASKMYDVSVIEQYGHQEPKNYHVPLNHESNYYYPTNHGYSGMVTGHAVSVAQPRNDNLNDCTGPDQRSRLNNAIFNFEAPMEQVLVIPRPIVTANLGRQENNPAIEKPRNKELGKRQKHVRRACIHCKKAHLACDESRPCKRCTHLGKAECIDVQHKRRGRPRTSPEKSMSHIKQEYHMPPPVTYDDDMYSYRRILELDQPEGGHIILQE